MWEAHEKLGELTLQPVITGSGGLALANHLGIPFTQEVIAVSTSLKALAPQTDVAIELGGEDAKIIYFEGGNVEQRMNGICAGGTGSFIDQMASLLQTDATGLNEYAKDYKALYPIAARCGVFAKTDIQPLINDGATKPDLSASIFQAVVNQTISGLACGKPIRGHVAFLGGPLHFLSELRESFIRTLKLDEEHTIIPENSHLFAAIGSALNAKEDNSISLTEMKDRLRNSIKLDFEVERMEPLFASQEEYDTFAKRQSSYKVKTGDLATYKGNCYLGIDAGSTTTKTALVGEDGTLLYSFYSSNNGNPLKTTINSIKEIYSLLPEDAEIAFSCPRLRPIINNDKINPKDVHEPQLLQVICAYRLFMPFASITISTRECQRFRDNVVDIAATKISAGVDVGIGGHDGEREKKGDEQFEISDSRNVDEVYKALTDKGLQPVMSDYIYV